MNDADGGINHEARACGAWPHLIDRAQRRLTIGYAELGKLIGGVHQRAIGRTLGPIQDHCLAEKLPPLTILVVQKAAGRPGGGFIAWDVDDIDTGLKRVFAYPWKTIPNPFAYASDPQLTQASLAHQLVGDPDTAESVFALVGVRGVAQRIFREALLEAYDHSCAFCGMTFSEALDAAHIVPWTRSTNAQRLDPRNGLLLCRTHHALFDEGHLWIDEEYRLHHDDSMFPPDSYSPADIWFTKQIHGRRITLPADERLHPDPACIALRYRSEAAQQGV